MQRRTGGDGGAREESENTTSRYDAPTGIDEPFRWCRELFAHLFLPVTRRTVPATTLRMASDVGNGWAQQDE